MYPEALNINETITAAFKVLILGISHEAQREIMPEYRTR